jgi:hypothetical protein
MLNVQQNLKTLSADQAIEKGFLKNLYQTAMTWGKKTEQCRIYSSSYPLAFAQQTGHRCDQISFEYTLLCYLCQIWMFN